MRITRSKTHPKIVLYSSDTQVKAEPAEDVLPDITADNKPDIKPVIAKKPRKKSTKLTDKPKTIPSAPPRWEEVYDLILNQRKTIEAPVDTMGCEQGGRDPGEEHPSFSAKKLAVLVSLMLSSQTKDNITHQAMKNLHHNLSGGLTVESLDRASEEEIDGHIGKVGFHTKKSRFLKQLAQSLKEHGGEVPEDYDSLVAFNGVGPKMAFLYLQAIGINAGIGVDVHVHRITNRLGWHGSETKTPEETRANLESWLPITKFREINPMLVGFGQMVCKPVGPKCDECDVGKVPGLCPSRVVKTKGKTSTLRVKQEDICKQEMDW